MKKISLIILILHLSGMFISVISKEKPKIVVVPFSAFSGIDRRYSDMVTSSIIANLQNQKVVTVLERSSLDLILKEANRSLSGIVNGDEAIGAGKLKGADYLIVGKLYSLSTYSISAYMSISWRMYRIIDGSLVQQSFEIYSKASGTRYSDPKSTAIQYTVEKAGEEISRAVSNLFPIETQIAAVKEFDKSDRYAESVFLSLGIEDGLQEDQKLLFGIKYPPNSNHIYNFGLLEVDKFENGLALCDIKKGEKYVKIDSINSNEGTSPYFVRSGFSGLVRANKASISILPLTGKINQVDKEVLYELLSSRIFNSSWFTLPDRGKIAEELRKKELKLSGLTKDLELQTLGQSVGVDAVLIGDVEKCNVNNRPFQNRPGETNYVVEFRINARLVEVKTGQVIWTGTFDNASNTPSTIAKLGLGLLGLRVVDRGAIDRCDAIIKESIGSFDNILTSMFGKYPMEDTVATLYLVDDEIDKIFIPFGVADGLSTQVDNVRFLMFEKEDFMGKTREIPVAKLEIEPPVDYHLTRANIDEKLVKENIDKKKKYYVRLILE